MSSEYRDPIRQIAGGQAVLPLGDDRPLVDLIGDVSALEEFRRYVPAPVETFTRLNWPVDTSAISARFTAAAKKEREERAAVKAARAIG